MALVILDNIIKSYKGEILFQDVSLQINENDKIGLIGNNGTGKTTLLEIICGEKEADLGKAIRSPRYTFGYLPQTLTWTQEGSIGDYLWEAFQDQIDIHQKLNILEERMAREADEKLLEDYARLRDEYEELGGYSCESRIKGVLNGLGISDIAMNRPLRDFSGGEKTKIALSRLLLEEPDLLLLDEPTNHLDRENREWLANYLKDYRGCLFVVSHDRYFLDQITNKILEIEDKRLYSYEGNYSAYKGQREIIVKNWQREYEKQQDEIAALEDFVRRYKAGQRTKEARSRERQLERMVKINPPPRERKKIKITFPLLRESGREVLKVENLSIKAGNNLLFSDINIDLRRGDKVALLGANGTGKTTFLKTLLGKVPTKSLIQWGHGVSWGYYEQEGGDLSPTNSVFNAIADAGLNYKQDIMDLCGAFRFSGEEAEKTIGQLSGGELARLNIALLTLKKANVLLLDEPTNHLDIALQEWLCEALQKFKGTVIFTSHDRYFIESIATMFWKIEDKSLYVYKGSYEEFLEWEKARQKQEDKPVKKQKPIIVASKNVNSNKIKIEQEKIEAAIQKLEEEIREMEILFSDPNFYQDNKEFDHITKDYHQKKESLTNLYKRWEETINL